MRSLFTAETISTQIETISVHIHFLFRSLLSFKRVHIQFQGQNSVRMIIRIHNITPNVIKLTKRKEKSWQQRSTSFSSLLFQLVVSLVSRYLIALSSKCMNIWICNNNKTSVGSLQALYTYRHLCRHFFLSPLIYYFANLCELVWFNNAQNNSSLSGQVSSIAKQTFQSI